jgi:hypothetical protein
VDVGLHDIPHAFSPDSALLALGSGRTPSIVVVDVQAMRQIGKLEFFVLSARCRKPAGADVKGRSATRRTLLS